MMASRAFYTHDEIQQLYALADEPGWLTKVEGSLAERSYHSLREKMTEVRKAAGIKVPRGPRPGFGGSARACDDNWQDNVPRCTARLLEATLRVGRWS